jgi:hypothetical protein
VAVPPVGSEEACSPNPKPETRANDIEIENPKFLWKRKSED